MKCGILKDLKIRISINSVKNEGSSLVELSTHFIYMVWYYRRQFRKLIIIW
jgi:hypothetical protein